MKRSAVSTSEPVLNPTATGEFPSMGSSWLTGSLVGLLVLAPLVPTEAAGQGTTAILSLLWMLVFAAAWGLAYRCRCPVPFDRVDGLCLALACWVVFLMLLTGPRANPRATLHVGWHWISLLSSVWLVRHLFTSDGQRRALMGTMVALSVGLAAHGLFQFAIGFPHQRAEYMAESESRKEEILRENGIDPDPRSAQRHQFEDRLRSTEPYATFGLANSLAGVIATWLVVALAITFSARADAGSSPGPSASTRVAQVGALLLLLACLVLTKSRSAWIAGGAGLGLLAWRERTRLRSRAGLLAGALVVVAATVAGGALAGALDWEVLTESLLSLTYRCQYWRAAIAMVAESPWVGCGPGNFQDYYALYKLPEASEMVADPHSFPLEIAATLGVPGLVLFCLLVASCVRACRAPGSPGDRPGEVPRASQTRMDGNHEDGLAWQSERPIVVGATAGLIVSAGYGWVIGFPPDEPPWFRFPLIWLIVLPVAAATYAGLRRWIQVGQWRSAAAWIGWVVLSVNLLAAGGISYGGVAQSYWLLLALVAFIPPDGRGKTKRGSADDGHRGASSFGALVALALLAACIYTEYLPSVRGQNLLRQAQSAREGQGARDLLRAASRADPWDAEPWRQLATLELHQWITSGDAASRAAWEEAIDSMRERDRASQAVAWQEGEMWLLAYRARDQESDLERSLVAFQRAARLYPNGNTVHAQLAWVAHLAGQERLAREHAEIALSLDARNPHWEQKLERRPVLDPGPAAGQSGQVDRPPNGGNAEQVMRQLRREHGVD